MKKIISVLIISTSLPTMAAPAPFPVFLKAGFSSVLEFDELPTRVVLGDPQVFQVEKLEHSLAIKTLQPYAATNMFVYFKSQEPRLFILTASEDAVPTYYKKFETLVPKPEQTKGRSFSPVFINGTRLISSQFDARKDYLTIEFDISSDSQALLKPNWEMARLRYGMTTITPTKLWAERREVQKDSKVRARFIFSKPNVPRNLHGVSVVIPIIGSTSSLGINLDRKTR